MFYRNKLTNLIIKYGRLCGEKNYTPGYSGNISARYREGMLITTSGSSNGCLAKKDIVYTNFEGSSLETGKKPSSEKFIQTKAGYKFYFACTLSLFEFICFFRKGFDGTGYGRECLLFWRNSSG